MTHLPLASFNQQPSTKSMIEMIFRGAVVIREHWTPHHTTIADMLYFPSALDFISHRYCRYVVFSECIRFHIAQVSRICCIFRMHWVSYHTDIADMLYLPAQKRLVNDMGQERRQRFKPSILASGQELSYHAWLPINIA